jgi:acetyl esterase/lipase
MKRITAVFLWLLVGSGYGLGLLPQAQEEAAPQAAGTPAGPAAGSVAVDENVLYATVNGAPLHLDVYEPAEKGSGLRAAVILIHGGGWKDLDKSTMRGMGNFLVRHGFVAFAVDYRLFDGTENAWPAQLDDVQRAVRWVRAHAERYGVNPARIGAFGHSAGAQLAALLGMEETRDNSDAALAKYSSRVQAVVDVSGPTDFTTDRVPEDRAFLTRFFGADYAQHPEVWREASPVYHVAKDVAPFLIVHGIRDESVPLTQPQELLEKLQAAGVPAAFIKVDDLHTFRTPEARRELALETLAFFNRNLNAPPGASYP